MWAHSASCGPAQGPQPCDAPQTPAPNPSALSCPSLSISRSKAELVWVKKKQELGIFPPLGHPSGLQGHITGWVGIRGMSWNGALG